MTDSAVVTELGFPGLVATDSVVVTELGFPGFGATFIALLLALTFVGCRCQSDEERLPPEGLVDAGVPALPAAAVVPPHLAPARCPPDMVDVAGEFCVDRFEGQLVDQNTAWVLSPFYHPLGERARLSREYWAAREAPAGALSLGRLPLLPELPRWQLAADLRPRAENRVGVLPQGYMSGVVARLVCENAGKRLCREHEWVRACRGERGQAFPYGAVYEQGACNVARASHPAAMLHGDASKGHRDPRLNLLADADGPLLRPTGSSPRCRSEWGNDAIYDMVGNVDEWVDDERGVFVGGFYSRQTRAGCAARVSAHPNAYFDYSLGVRCCR